MIKLLIYDITGVLTKSERFSVQYSELFGIPYESVLSFFKSDFQNCLIGKSDLKREIKPWLEKWKSVYDPDSFLELWFKLENDIDIEIFRSVFQLQEKEYETVIATHQEKYRLKYIKETMKLDRVFERIYSSCNLGIKKNNPDFFRTILSDYGLKPEEAVFFDNDKKNIESAKSLGIDAVLVENNKDYFDRVNKL
ncbi:HAD-IA family hydrolase [Candidatus Dojkabacteria bacterium]|nr:HAD-IA family hydrolase [Candidatus Dojkabacteria bacterium]